MQGHTIQCELVNRVLGNFPQLMSPLDFIAYSFTFVSVTRTLHLIN